RYVDVANEPTGPELDRLVELARAEHPDAVAVSWYRFWSYDGRHRALRVYAPAADPVIDVDHPLTGTNREGRVIAATYGWRRVDGGVELVRRHLVFEEETAVGAKGWEVPDD